METYLNLINDAIIRFWDAPALSDYHKGTLSCAEIAEKIEKIHLIYEKAGIVEGDKVALAGKNCARWAVAFLATVTNHSVAVPILNDFTPDNIQALAVHSESKVLFTEKKIWRNINPDEMPSLVAAVNLEDYEILYVKDEDIRGQVSRVEELYAEKYPEGLKPSDIDYRWDNLDALTVINYTSGTTGTPKGIMLTVRNLSSNINFGLKGIPVCPDDTAVSMLPLAHMYGLTFEFLYKFCGGCHIYFLGKTPTPSILMAAFDEVKPYQIVTVPLVLEKIVKTKVMPILEKRPVKVLTAIPGVNRIIYNVIRKKVMAAFGGKVKDIIIGGAAFSAPVEEVLRKVHIPYTVGYGMTECAPIIGYEPCSTFVKGSCGKIVDNMEIRVASSDPQNIVGELQVHGANVMAGYYKNDEATKEAFTEDGWLRTGDLGIVDRHGNIFIRGRSKCMILTANGQNIYPEEIESILNSMPYITESIIVGRDKNLVAIVSIDQKALEADGKNLEETLEATRRNLNTQLPAYSHIAKMELVSGEFVHTPKKSIKRCLYN